MNNVLKNIYFIFNYQVINKTKIMLFQISLMIYLVYSMFSEGFILYVDSNFVSLQDT